MPRGVRTSDKLKPDLVEALCKKIGCSFNSTVFNHSNGTITKELLQEVCKYLKYSNYNSLKKEESAKIICERLKLSCDNIDFNTGDGTGSAGFIEKILIELKKMKE
jgi:hypothetical protein